MTLEAEQRSHELEVLKREPTCAECLLFRPTKRHLGIDYCVDCYPEAAGE